MKKSIFVLVSLPFFFVLLVIIASSQYHSSTTTDRSSPHTHRYGYYSSEHERIQSIQEDYENWLSTKEAHDSEMESINAEMESMYEYMVSVSASKALAEENSTTPQETATSDTRVAETIPGEITPSPPSPSYVYTKYILNTNTKVFHYPGCYSVSRMDSKNKEVSRLSRKTIIANGYRPCGKCNP